MCDGGDEFIIYRLSIPHVGVDVLTLYTNIGWVDGVTYMYLLEHVLGSNRRFRRRSLIYNRLIEQSYLHFAPKILNFQRCSFCLAVSIWSIVGGLGRPSCVH